MNNLNDSRSKQKNIRAAIAASALFLPLTCASQGWATPLPQVPSSAAPEHVEERFQPTVEPSTESVTVPTPKPPVAAKGSLAQQFVLKSVVVEGSTVYTEHSFDDIFQSKIGQKITFADAHEIARAITTRYRSNGYILSQAIVSDKSLAEAKHKGVLHIRVVEGFINKITIENQNPGADKRDLIGSYAEKIKNERPLTNAALERYMLLINDLPGVKARAILRPSPDTFGAADLIIQVQNKPIEASFTSDNRGNKFLGPYQEQATVTENSVAGLGERTTLRYINTLPFSDLHYFDVQHEEQLGTEGTRMIAFASFTKTDPGDILRPLQFKGTSDDYSLTFTHPFLRSRAENFTGRIVFDARDTENYAEEAPISRDRVRAIRVGGTYDTNDAWNGVDLANLMLSQGVGWPGATENGVGRTRAVGEQEFTKGNLDVSRLQNLPHGFSLLAAGSGQYSSEPLLTSEQFTLGGVGFGQAYDSGELSGDKAIAGKLELRYGQAVGERWFNSYQLYSYYDIGSITINKAAPGTSDSLSLASLGAGIRANFTSNLYGYLEVGLPLTRNIASEDNKDPRIFFSLTARY